MEKIKVIFVLGEDGWDGSYSETLWAEKTPDGLILDNIPFFKKKVCLEDVVEGDLIAEKIYQYTKTIKKSANSVYRVLFKSDTQSQARSLLAKIEADGCIYETNKINEIYLAAINIPEYVDINGIWKIIDNGLKSEIWEVQEGDDRHPKDVAQQG
jgi:Domain of unknown function (DUF4265)